MHATIFVTGQVNEIKKKKRNVCRNKTECHLTGYFLCVGRCVSQQRIKLSLNSQTACMSSSVMFYFPLAVEARSDWLSAFFREAKTVVLQRHLFD